MAEQKRKAGWYLPIHIFDAINNIALETRDNPGDIVKELIEAGLSRSSYTLQSERQIYLKNYYDNVTKRLLKCLGLQPNGGINPPFGDLTRGLSSVRATKTTLYKALLFDYKELLDDIKNKSPDLYREYMHIVRNYPKIYKEVRTIEPKNRTVRVLTNYDTTIDNYIENIEITN